MSISSDSIWAASPSTTRGQPTPLSADAKGERIAYASNRSIFLRSIDQPEISKQYTGHTSQTTVARFSPSGYWVASGDVAGTVRVWDAVGEGSTKEYSIIAGRINDIAWDGDSQRIIAVGNGKERFGHCITADSGNSVGEISGHSSQINCVSIRQQRPLRAATGSDDTSLVFYHGAPFKYNTSLRNNHNKFVYGTAFSPDGSSLVSVGSDRRIWLYDGKTGETRKQIGDFEHTGSIFGVSWAKDSKSFVTASADQTVRCPHLPLFMSSQLILTVSDGAQVKIWDAEVGKVTQTWRMGDENVVSIQDQQVGVVWPHGRSDGLIISVDLEGNLNYVTQGNPVPAKVVRGHQRNITATGLTSSSSDTSTLYTGSYEGRIRAWNVSKGSASAIDGESHSNYVSGFATAGSDRIYSVGWDDTLRSIDTTAQTFINNPASKTSGQPKGIAHSNTGTLLIATPNSIEIFSSESGEKTGELHVKGFAPTCISTPQPSSSNAFVAVGCDDKSVRIYNLFSSSPPSLKLAAEIKTLTSLPTVLAFSPSNALLAIGTASGGISVFNTSDWSLSTSRWSAHTARVTALDWSADSKFTVSGALDTNIFVWSVASPGKRVKAGGAHNDGVSGAVWVESEGGKGKIISVGADASVKVWKVEGLL